MKSPVIAIVASVLALGIGASTLAYTLRSDVEPLMDARSLTPLPGAAPFYVWINSDTALILRNPSQPSLTRYSLTSKSESPDKPLTALFQKTHGRADSLRIAPDGAFLLWSSEDLRRTYVASIDGATFNETLHPSPSLTFWRADGQRWIALEIRNERVSLARSFAREKPIPSAYTPLSNNLAIDSNTSVISQATLTDSGQFMVQVREGKDQPMKQLHLLILAFAANPAFTQTMAFPAPHSNQGGEVFFAQGHFMMGWALRFQQPLPNLLKEFGVGEKPTTKLGTGFWITNQQTKQTIPLGYIETTRNDPNSGPFNVQFTPDGRNISYVYQNALYLLPVRFP